MFERVDWMCFLFFLYVHSKQYHWNSVITFPFIDKDHHWQSVWPHWWHSEQNRVMNEPSPLGLNPSPLRWNSPGLWVWRGGVCRTCQGWRAAVFQTGPHQATVTFGDGIMGRRQWLLILLCSPWSCVPSSTSPGRMTWLWLVENYTAYECVYVCVSRERDQNYCRDNNRLCWGRKMSGVDPCSPSLQMIMIIMAAIDVLWPWHGKPTVHSLNVSMASCNYHFYALADNF